MCAVMCWTYWKLQPHFPFINDQEKSFWCHETTPVDHTVEIWTRDWLYTKIHTQYRTSPNPNLNMIPKKFPNEKSNELLNEPLVIY